jgi:alkylation response protein AidB-like acyl-CoA dehydrogenase
MEFGWSDAQQAAYQECASFAREQLNDNLRERDEHGEFRKELWQKCCDFGITGWRLPAEYGGAAVDVVSTVRRLEGIGYGCRDNALTLGLNGQIWTVQEPLLEFGSESQKMRYLPRLCSGELLAADAITEPQSGSDAFSLETRAERVDGGYLLNGQKSYIGLAPVAGISLVYASTNPAARQWGVSAFIVESGFDGYRVSPPREKMGLRTSYLGDIVLEDCFVPEENRLGGEGAGFTIFNYSSNWERSFIFSSHVGAMARQLDACVEYAAQRQQFGKPIAAFQAVSNRLAEMKLRLETSQLLLYKLAWLKQRGEQATMESAMAKLHLGEAIAANSLDAMRIHGARGYLKEYEVEREVRDALGGLIYGGTSDIQRNIIARLLGR